MSAIPIPWLRLLVLLGPILLLPAQIVDAQSPPPADEPKVEDGWVHQRDDQTGILVLTKELALAARAEADPALRFRLLPDDFDMLDGNAGLYYMKAIGFLEQDPARQRLAQFHQEAIAQGEKEGKAPGDVPPYVWLETPPNELPHPEVKEYLQWMSFQVPFIREAARRRRFDMDRNLRDVDDLIAYLLPEVQGLRELARTQSIRCRLAIAEGRIDDAIEITGQQFALARHIGQDDFLVSNLVGIAIANIAWNDALYLIQHPQAPNLYWALATMPSPLIDIRHAMATERQFLYQQLKVLQDVDETPRPPGYWQDFIDRLAGQLGSLASELKLRSPANDSQTMRVAMVGFVAAAYPGAKEYLIQRVHLPREQVEAYPTAQVVFLAMVKYHNHARDEVFKWMYLPYWQFREKTAPDQVEQRLQEDADQFGWCTSPTQLLLPAVLAARTAEARCDQSIALLQTVEAIRMYAAAHQGKLPASLDDLPVPAPIEQFTGKPIDYEFLGDRAVLNGFALPGMRYRLVLRISQ